MKRLSLSALLLSVLVAPHAFGAAGSMSADVSLTPAGSFVAKSDEVTGEAIQEGDTIHAENVKVKLTNLKTGLPLRDKHTKDKYLEVAKFPEAVLVKATGKGGKGKGRMKLKNIEKDVEGTYKVEGGMMLAEFPIKLSDYGINSIKYMGVGVDDEVKVHVNLPIRKK